ncbi:MAG: hypothetical protein MJZ36_04655 [Bacteroidaceae bacterium]|nr:hypothetical protein [Bacteroidaceae bacterium]
MERQILNTTVNLHDEDNRFENDKDVKVVLKFVTSKKEFHVTVPIVRKVDRTPNEFIFESKKLNFKVSICKDGRLSPSGRISQKMAIDLGEDNLIEEFRAAAMKIWNHVNASI